MLLVPIKLMVISSYEHLVAHRAVDWLGRGDHVAHNGIESAVREHLINVILVLFDEYTSSSDSRAFSPT